MATFLEFRLTKQGYGQSKLARIVVTWTDTSACEREGESNILMINELDVSPIQYLELLYIHLKQNNRHFDAEIVLLTIEAVINKSQ